MILLDSSVWIDHIRYPEPDVTAALTNENVLQHPFVTAEIALGSIRNRQRVVEMLDALPASKVAGNAQLLAFVEEVGLHGTGIGMVDAHLLVTAQTEGARVWTRDKRLAAQAKRLGVAYTPG